MSQEDNLEDSHTEQIEEYVDPNGRYTNPMGVKEAPINLDLVLEPKPNKSSYEERMNTTKNIFLSCKKPFITEDREKVWRICVEKGDKELKQMEEVDAHINVKL